MGYEPAVSTPVMATRPGSVLMVTIVTADGVRSAATPADLREIVAAGKFFWIDIVGGDEGTRTPFVSELGFEELDVAWVQRFGQTGRMVIARQRLRVVTWLSERLGRGFTEIHILASRKCILTLWDGDASVLDEIREHYAERAVELEKSPLEAVAILLQLLLGTLHNAISEIDAQIQAVRTQIRQEPGSIDLLVAHAAAAVGLVRC
jgi:Mg2+ and Co2+ transporter CorA